MHLDYIRYPGEKGDFSHDATTRRRFAQETAGWSGTDSGGVYMLGDFALGGYLSCDGETDVVIGHFEQCVGATFTGGSIVTDPILRLGWVGLVKN